MRIGEQLPQWKKREIYLGFVAEEPKTHIARRLTIDRSTVYDYLRPIRHLGKAEVLTLIAQMTARSCANGHTSFKCLVCGIAHDNIMNEEYQEIIRLRKKVHHLEDQLKKKNEKVSISVAISTPDHPLTNPVVHL
jgi:hypothetical protein